MWRSIKPGVTFVLDRSGITGDDGPSHNGIWDLAITGIVPTMHVAAPRDGARLRETLREAVEISDAPSFSVGFRRGRCRVISQHLNVATA
jgi:1-deoxy-D-xylulose-5-phosphate synthase